MRSRPLHRYWLFSLLALLTLLACNFVERQFGMGPASPTPAGPSAARSATPTPLSVTPASPFPTQRPSFKTTLTATSSQSETPVPSGVRPCAYVPGVSTPAVMPPDVLAAYTPTPYPLPTLPANTPADAATTAKQLRIYQQLWNIVNEEYVYADYNGHDWKAIGAKYEALVKKGLTDEAFYTAMDFMIAELGDNHSRYDSPADVRVADEAFQGQADYTGVGIRWEAIPQADRGSIVYAYPGSPAAEAGLLAHDNILAVNGASLFDSSGNTKNIIRGPEGTTVTLTIQRAGETPFDVTLTRRQITSAQPIDYCLVAGTHLGYLFLPSLDDATLPGQVRAALQAFTADAPLDGLILDNRENGGGAETVLEQMLGFFTSGTQGHFVSHQSQRALTITPEAIGNSQTVPLVVLAGPNTASFGEIMSGVLQDSARARVVGQRTMGNVEILWGYDFEDGSRAWIAHETFQPLNLPSGFWEGHGIEPEAAAPTRWDLFTGATDPAFAIAVQLLR